MQDRFKFRAWNSLVKKFNYFDQPEIQIGTNGFDSGLIFPLSENSKLYMGNYLEPQFCTGLKDMNGKLIYEGDIVFNNCGRWIIKYCDKCKSYQCFDNTFGCFACLGDYNWFEFIDDLNDTVVKGNIYENSELLEDGE